MTLTGDIHDLGQNDVALQLLENWTESAWSKRDQSLEFADSDSFDLDQFYRKKSRVDIKRVSDKVSKLSPEEFYG